MDSTKMTTAAAAAAQQADRCANNNRGNSPVLSVMEQTGRMIIAENARHDLGNVYNNRLNVNYELMKSEFERLKTFSTPPVWSTPFIRPEDCADAGFFFLHDGDKVQCAFCRGVAGEWEEGDIPIIEHRRHFPRCPFICNLPVGNIPRNRNLNNGESNENHIGDVTSSGVSSGSSSERSGESDIEEYIPGIDVCGPFDADSMRSQYLTNSRNISLRGAQPLVGNLDDVTKNLSIQPCRGPDNANMVTAIARLKSYQNPNWSLSTPQSPDPEKLSEAGFYYIGCSDHVKCFYCGGGLRNWESGEDPWVQHAKWFPRCTFVHLNKGDSFVESVNGNGNGNGLNSSLGNSPCSSVSLSHSNSSDEEEPSVTPPSEESELSKTILKAHCSKTKVKNSDEVPNTKSNSSSGNSSGDESGLSSVSKDLEDEVRKLRDARICKVCMDKEVSVVFLPCGHLISCTSCATAFKVCALCRQPIQAVVRTYMS